MYRSKPDLIRCLILGLAALSPFSASAATKSNIVYILADDLGYGDVRILNPQGKIPTPHMDRLGAAGMVFTYAHSSSSVCTPSRYSNSYLPDHHAIAVFLNLHVDLLGPPQEESASGSHASPTR